MPAALTAEQRNALFIDQKLVDDFLARVDRFVNNVNKLGETLRSMKDDVKERITPAISRQETHAYQAPAAPTRDTVAVKSVVTPDDIDLDALLGDIDLNGAGITV